jgi:hypothetical protein
VDIVYVVGPNGTHEELRYSLRSLGNISHDQVWLVGHKPAWAVNVGHLPVPQKSTKWRNTTLSVREACKTTDISPTWALFNDDFFALERTTIPNWHRGPVDVSQQALQRPVRARRRRSHRDGRSATADLLWRWGYDDILNYDIHVPMKIRSDVMLDVLDRAAHANIEVLHKRTLYGNVAQVGGRQHEDPKITSMTETWSDRQKWVSTYDRSFEAGQVGRDLRARFPNPSPYEVDHG